jgi:hypothetical protein
MSAEESEPESEAISEEEEFEIIDWAADGAGNKVADEVEEYFLNEADSVVSHVEISADGPSAQELEDAVGGHREIKRDAIPCKAKLYAAFLARVKKLGPAEVARKTREKYRLPALQPIQTLRYARQLEEIWAAMRHNTNSCRVKGAGRRPSCLGKEKEALAKIIEIQNSRGRITRSEIGELLGARSAYVVSNFMERHGIRLRRGSVREPVGAEAQMAAVQLFVESAAKIWAFGKMMNGANFGPAQYVPFQGKAGGAVARGKRRPALPPCSEPKRLHE